LVKAARAVNADRKHILQEREINRSGLALQTS